MNLSTTLGWCACTLMLSASVCENIWRLRVLAVLTNLAFIAYACVATCPLAITAHLVLLPINAARLVATLRDHNAPGRGGRSFAGHDHGTAGALGDGIADRMLPSASVCRSWVACAPWGGRRGMTKWRNTR